MPLKETVLAGVAKAKTSLQNLIVSATLIKRGNATYVPGTDPTYSETSDTISLVITTFRTEEIDGDRIRATDMQGIVFPEDAFVDVVTNDLITASVRGIMNTYRVVQNIPIMAGDTIALHQMVLRLT